MASASSEQSSLGSAKLRAAAFPIALVASFVLLSGCGGRSREALAFSLPLVGAVELEARYREALRRADQGGAVLIVLWSTQVPPPVAFVRAVEAWSRYGLVSLAICTDLIDVPASMEAASRVRRWEQENRLPLPGSLYQGESVLLERLVKLPARAGSVILLGPQEQVLWRGDRFGPLEDLESTLEEHLGAPRIADLEEGCVCQVLAAAVQARSAA